MKRWASSATLVLLLSSPALAQPDTDKEMGMPVGSSVRSESGLPLIQATPGAVAPSSASANPILHVPVTDLHPGNVNFAPRIDNPLADDPNAATRGMRDFIQFNCVGCHAPNGGGGMGPSLSDRRFIYGAAPPNIFLSIYQGRPNGMPAWGEMLPESTIWELVSYVQSITHPSGPNFGKTISRSPLSPKVQQTPAEFLQTTDPWGFTEAFSSGQPPNGD
ncbi:MAG TPA: c-type cytochrome [Roseiarcus sp.]|jgi:cytochrome c oxidase cbb3-type subunit 3|nr:c-type cytochrome [Roseiarcus sp.]